MFRALFKIQVNNTLTKGSKIKLTNFTIIIFTELLYTTDKINTTTLKHRT